MNRMASVLVLTLVLLLCGTGFVRAAHTHAHVSISDGQNALSNSDDDWGVTCSSQANQVMGGAQASSGASVSWDTSHPYYISKTTSTWANTTNTPGYTSSHTPTYAHPYEYDVRLYGAGAVAGCKLWLESIELIVPVGSPANISMVDLNLSVDGTPLVWGHFMLAGDGSHAGDGWYIDSFFDVYSDGGYWHGEYSGPNEVDVELPVDTPLQLDFIVVTDAQVDLPAPASRAISMHTVTFGVPDDFILVDGTIAADLTCEPSSGTVPFSTLMSVSLDNLYTGQIRRIAGRMSITLGNGTHIGSWKAGFANVAPGSFYHAQWSQTIPALGTLLGDNIFDLVAEDITPAPFNQPPYPPAGDTATSFCVVTASAP